MKLPALLLSSIALTSPAAAQECLDVEIALVADISSSMNDQEKEIQRAGYVQAFRDPDVIMAIMEGYCGRIAVSYIEFGTEPHMVVDWHLISTDEDAEAFAQAIEAAPPTYDRIGTTGLANAMDFAAQSLLNNPFKADKLVLDISSDGIDNVTSNAAHVRDKYTKATPENGWAEVTINGMPILGGVHYGMTSDGFQEYFATQVIGGPGHFMEPAKGVHDIARAFRRKLVQEIG